MPRAFRKGDIVTRIGHTMQGSVVIALPWLRGPARQLLQVKWDNPAGSGSTTCVSSLDVQHHHRRVPAEAAGALHHITSTR